MYYGIYKSLRNSAWQCLLDFNITSLPVDVLKIARDLNIHVVKNSSVDDLEENERGKSYCNEGDWIIVYDDTCDVSLARFTLAHELGHILLGHDLICSDYPNTSEFSKKPLSEEQADAFALRLLCPACVIDALDVASGEDIVGFCKVPLNSANLRFKRLAELRKRNKFLSDPLERQVFENFKPFLSLHACYKEKS